MAATTTLLGLVTPTQGTLTGTWGDTVNYGISDYLDIAIAGTLSFAGDGAITLANTTGSSAGNSIGATTAQYAIIKVTGTLTTAKIITGPSYSKTYLVVNAATGSTVTFKASGQTGVSIAVGETALVYYNGTDYVKVVGTATAGAAGGSTTQVQYNNAGVLAGITGATTNGTALTLVAPVLGTPASATLTNATGLPISTGVSGLGTSVATALGVNVGTAGALVVNGGALGSPSSVGTMPAFTLGGTVSGGGNQINNVVIGTTTPLAGNFTALNATSAIITSFLEVKSDSSAIYQNNAANTRYWGSLVSGGSSIPNLDISYYNGSIVSTIAQYTANGLAVTGTLSATGTLSGGTSGTAYSFNGSAPATSLTLDSAGNVGIGTTNITSTAGWTPRLVLASATAPAMILKGPNSQEASVGSINGMYIDCLGNSTGTNNDIIFRNTSVNSSTAAFERMRIDSSGNLGLGVTPSAFLSSIRALQINNTGMSLFTYSASATVDQYAFLSNNSFQNSSVQDIYVRTNPAAQYRQLNGTHAWFNAPSGTAGNAITFTQAMTLDASGNLGIGTSSPSASDWNASATVVQANKNDTNGGLFKASSSNTNFIFSAGNNLAYIATTTNTPITFLTNTVERARITSVGNVSIGGTADRATTVGTKALNIFDGTAPVGTLANGVSFYSASGEANVMDAAGNATLLSPHDTATNKWIFRSKHTPTGKVLKIDVERLLKFVNDHFGLDAVHEFIED